MDLEDKVTSRVVVEAGGLIMRSTAALQLARQGIDQMTIPVAGLDYRSDKCEPPGGL
jgi:hypothetical protein